MTDVPGIDAPDHAAAATPAVDTRIAPTGTGELGRSWRDGELVERYRAPLVAHERPKAGAGHG
jgi:hypothetical protein